MKKIKIATLLLFSVISLSFFSFITTAQAGLLSSGATKELSLASETTRTTAGLNDMSVGDLVANIIGIILSLLGIIFVILIVFAGYRWLVASGNEEAVKKSKDTIKQAIIGLIIVLAAYAITYFVFKQLPFSGDTSAPDSTMGNGD
jgi:amino acid transporter